MADRRPDPDELLARVREQEKEAARGKLTIFFGSAPGVGKTYAMLEAARSEIDDQKRAVVVGVVETHGRYDTGSLLMGLELLPRRKVQHRGVELDELDLDGALARKPELLLVDELAHTNAPGSRHVKRWQDVEELLDAGIDVFTTLNVQHLESLNDVVAQITGVRVRETVPDAVFDKAYEVRVVDLPVDELFERLHAGKVYVPEQAARAIESFFREGNLIALRELALRRTAERVDAKMRGYKAAHGIEESWHTGERVLVCVSPSPYSARLVRAARRMATSLHAELVGVHVEPPAALRMSAADRERLAENMRLVESLGGEAVTLRGEDAAAETVRYARKRNVTKIVVGKPAHPRWKDVLWPSFLDEMVRQSKEIDVYAISGEPHVEGAARRKLVPARVVRGRRGGVGRRGGDRRLLVRLRARSAAGRRDGVPARRRARLDALRVRCLAPRGRLERRRVRLLLRPAVLQLRGLRSKVRADVRRDVPRRGDHQSPHHAHSRSGRRRTARGAQEREPVCLRARARARLFEGPPVAIGRAAPARGVRRARRRPPSGGQRRARAGVRG
jgi:two-component system sensor histidine kinase KdpD